MRAFWLHGYEGTSTRDLCEATGLDRSSVYNAFTSKHELFRRALIHYTEAMTATQTEILEDADRPAVERIRALFAKIIDDEFTFRGEAPSIGCLGVNTTVEFGGRDPEIARLLEQDAARRLETLRAAIEAGRRDGDVRSPRDPASLARYLNAVTAGIRVAAQGGADRATLESIAETALDALTSPPALP
ncbi:TetR/AcrR family transcriptional regulator [Nonomuraea sp. RK-328]|nr:TetR/AcrR family transcriptional regulator [Nonomuraea sp. RK-328]